ncbi:hypothetical protein ACVWWQ_000568 [Rhodanobacter sp. TND4EL1]
MKPTLFVFVLASILGLAACHASRDAPTPSASGDPRAAGADKKIEKSRNAMLEKGMDVKNEHWTANPASAASTAATSSTMTPAIEPAPAASGSSSAVPAPAGAAGTKKP